MSGIKERAKKVAEGNAFLFFLWRCLRVLKHCTEIAADLMRKRDKYCIICGHKVGRFAPLLKTEDLPEVSRKYHIIGGVLSENCVCPYCREWDRHRWQYYVLKNYSGILEAGECSVLHFAPEKSNSDLIRQNRKCKYITADIEEGRGDIVADMTNLNMFGDDTFDYIIANHVIDDIADEAKAISELKRVLKNDGTIILSFPICTDITTTYEDTSLATEEEKWEILGDRHSVRLYGTDYKERLESYGLNVKTYSPQNELTDEEITRYGFIPDDVSVFCTLKH